jgi:hypothetical protein
MVSMKEFLSEASEQSFQNYKKDRLVWTEREIKIVTKLAQSVVNGEASQAVLKRLFKESVEAGTPLRGLENKTPTAFYRKINEIYKELKEEQK